MQETISRTRKEQEQQLLGLAMQMGALRNDVARSQEMPEDYVNYLAFELAAVQAEFDALYSELNQPEQPAKPAPCPWFRLIRRFYAIAKEHGMDLKAEERMRGALSTLLGRRIGSRTELGANDWAHAGDALKAGALFW